MQRVFGQYRLVERIGTGGMAEVYRAKREGQIFFSRRRGQRKFSREVAVKLILPHLSREESFRELFSREAHLASLLDHPNIVDIQDYGRLDNVDFIVMEYVRGVDLSKLLKALPRGDTLPEAHCLHILYRVARALAFAHGQTSPEDAPEGIIHCDLSPHNILISTEGEIKLADFGIARAARPDSTRTGTLRGKAPYMSPEQVEGGVLDHRSDLFSLGSIAYQMFTGRHPFTRSGDAATLAAIREGHFQPLDPASGLPDELVKLVHSLLEMDPGKRPPGASAVTGVLEPHLEPQSEVELGERVSRLVKSADESPEPLPTAVTLPRPRGFRLPVSAGIFVMIFVAVWLLSRPVVPERGDLGTALPEDVSPDPLAAQVPGPVTGQSGTEEAAVLTITTDPAGAVLTANGLNIGRSPAVVKKPAPGEDIRLTAHLYGFQKGEVLYRSGTHPRAISIPLVPLATSTVRVGAVPWAEVFYRGQSVGYTPLTLEGIPVGERTFLLKNDAMGLRHEVTLEVRTEGPNLISRNLEGTVR
jgi:serine/threonine protein kinase